MLDIILMGVIGVLPIAMLIPIIQLSGCGKEGMSFKEWCRVFAIPCWLCGAMFFICIIGFLHISNVLHNSIVNKVLLTLFWTYLDLLLILLFYINPVTVSDDLEKWCLRIGMTTMLCLPLLMIGMTWIML